MQGTRGMWHVITQGMRGWATAWMCKLEAALVHPVAVHAVVAVWTLFPRRPSPDEFLLLHHLVRLHVLLATQLAGPAVAALVPEAAKAVVVPDGLLHHLLLARALPLVSLARIRRCCGHLWRSRHGHP